MRRAQATGLIAVAPCAEEQAISGRRAAGRDEDGSRDEHRRHVRGKVEESRRRNGVNGDGGVSCLHWLSPDDVLSDVEVVLQHGGDIQSLSSFDGTLDVSSFLEEPCHFLIIAFDGDDVNFKRPPFDTFQYIQFMSFHIQAKVIHNTNTFFFDDCGDRCTNQLDHSHFRAIEAVHVFVRADHSAKPVRQRKVDRLSVA